MRILKQGSFSSFGSSGISPILSERNGFKFQQPVGMEMTLSETYNITMKDGVVNGFLLTGDIVLHGTFPFTNVEETILSVLSKDELGEADLPEYFYIKVKAPTGTLGRLAENKMYLTSSEPLSIDEVSPDYETRYFTMHFSALLLLPQHPVTIIKYEILPLNPLQKTPFILAPQYKFSESQTDLMVSLKLNQECQGLQVSKLSQIAVAVPVIGGAEEPPLTKPPGIWDPEKQLIVWNVSDLEAFQGESHETQLMARCFVVAEGKQSPAALKFELSDSILSKVEVGAFVCVSPPKNLHDDAFPPSSRVIPLSRLKLGFKSKAGKYLGD
jgi:hypothetical protein